MTETYTLIDIVRAAHEQHAEWKKLQHAGEHRIRTDWLIRFIHNLTGYTLHFGGERLVENGVKVSAVLHDGSIEDCITGHIWGWEIFLAYRIIDQPKPKVDRSLRGHVMVKKTHTICECLATCSGTHEIGPHGFLNFYSWPQVESSGWEVYKP